MSRVTPGKYVHPRRRVRDPAVTRLYHEIRRDLPCEYCRIARGTELNHILHGSKKEDAFYNFQISCRDCHQDPVYGFHGSQPRWTVKMALERKLAQGFVLPRAAYAYLDGGVDAWPGTDPDPAEAERLARRIADDERFARVALFNPHR